MLKFLKSLRKRDVVEFKETQYMCLVNDETHTFDTKEDMLKYIESYSKVNVVYSLNMFKVDLFNLIK